jgi:hypothetical protein
MEGKQIRKHDADLISVSFIQNALKLFLRHISIKTTEI